MRTGRQAEQQLAPLAACVSARDLDRGVGRLDRGPGRREHVRSRVGQLDVRAGPVEQPHAELALEPGDLLAEGRLGDVQALGGAAEVELVGERDERAQEPRVGVMHGAYETRHAAISAAAVCAYARAHEARG